jgi:hypothetical protein
MHRPYFPLLLTLLVVSVTSFCAIPVTILLYIFFFQNKMRPREVFIMENTITEREPLKSSRQHLRFDIEQRGSSFL